MGTLILFLILGLSVFWPSWLSARVSSRRGKFGFGWFVVGPISAAIVGALAYFLYPIFFPYPYGSQKALESFLVYRGVISSLLACAVPWVVYLCIKVYWSRRTDGAQ